ncbi:MAG: glutathione S-transferase N-terminal domain-containing protein [Acidobacteriota bacterium]|nr:glutathione S-transferase N-terminal domain-containing protein [Acidobacteriota bacterium]
MDLRLYVVHGSHPCAAVQKALDLKGLPCRVVEWPPPLHAPIQKLLFGARTVPAMVIDGEKISGSRAIMRRLDELAPEPPLYPADPALRARVEEAERWGDEVFQPVAREIIWVALGHSPQSMPSYTVHSRLAMPPAALRLSAPLITRLARAINRTDDARARADIGALPAQLDMIDAWIADGTIGDAAQPNAADLQILSTVRLLMTMADLRPLIEGRPCAALAMAVFPQTDGEVPSGALSAA